MKISPVRNKNKNFRTHLNSSWSSAGGSIQHILLKYLNKSSRVCNAKMR